MREHGLKKLVRWLPDPFLQLGLQAHSRGQPGKSTEQLPLVTSNVKNSIIWTNPRDGLGDTPAL